MLKVRNTLALCNKILLSLSWWKARYIPRLLLCINIIIYITINKLKFMYLSGLLLLYDTSYFMFVLLATQTIFKRNEECKNQTRKCIWCRIAKSLFDRTFLFTLVHLRQNCNFIQHAFCIMLSAININLGNHNIWLRMQSCDEKEVFFKAFIYLVFTKLWNVLIQSTHVHMVLKSEAFSIFIESADFRYCNITYIF